MRSSTRLQEQSTEQSVDDEMNAALALQEWLLDLRGRFENDQGVLLWGYAASKWLGYQGEYEPICVDFGRGSGEVDLFSVMTAAGADMSSMITEKPKTRAARALKSARWYRVAPGTCSRQPPVPRVVLVGDDWSAEHVSATCLLQVADHRRSIVVRSTTMTPHVLLRAQDDAVRKRFAMDAPLAILHASEAGFPCPAAVGVAWAAASALCHPNVSVLAHFGARYCIPTRHPRHNAAQRFITAVNAMHEAGQLDDLQVHADGCWNVSDVIRKATEGKLPHARFTRLLDHVVGGLKLRPEVECSGWGSLALFRVR